MSATGENLLGKFLRDRRSRLDVASFGFSTGRRRTPGLRREEVALLANISPTWYTWLEQGRGGAPSADVLDRIARAMMLTEPEREHLFVLGLGHPPDLRYKGVDTVTPRLQRVLDAFEFSPAVIKTPLWDIVAWNRAASILLTDYAALPRERRNILRLLFGHPNARAAQQEWHSVARTVVGAFRADVARIGVTEEVTRLVDELCELNPEFQALWLENDVSPGGEGIKRIRHPEAGSLDLEFSTFAVDARPELSLVVYNPATPETAERMRTFIAARSG